MSAARSRKQTTHGGRERILDAATELFSERGYAGTSVDAICERAGVTKPVVYWHFESKEGLLAAVLEALSGTLIEEIQKRTDAASPSQDRLTRMTSAWREAARKNAPMLRLPLVAALEHKGQSERVRAALQRVRERAERAIVAGIEEVLGRSLPDLELVAHVILTLVQGAMLRHAVDHDDERLERNLAEMRRVVALSVVSRLPAAEQRGILEHFVPQG